MKNDAVQITALVAGLVLSAAAQDLLPSFGGAKPPFLLAFALSAATAPRPRRDAGEPVVRHAWIAAALGAGALSDGLGGTAPGCALLFFPAACLVARLSREALSEMPSAALGLMATAIAAPLFELWLVATGVVGTADPTLVRFFAAALPAAVVGAVVFPLLARVRRLVGLVPEAYGADDEARGGAR